MDLTAVWIWSGQCRVKKNDDLVGCFSYFGLFNPFYILVIMRALTSVDDKEIMECLEMLKTTTAGKDFMHESFHKNDANRFTRSWFAWANALFGELILTLTEERPHLIF